MGFIDIIINKKIAEGKQIGDLSSYLVPQIDAQAKVAAGALANFTHDNNGAAKYQILIACGLTNANRDGRWAVTFYPNGTLDTGSQAGIFDTVYQGAANDSAHPFANLKEPLVLAPGAGISFINSNSVALDNIVMYLIYLEVEI